MLVGCEEEQAWIVTNGTEVAGISLPGLRRLFEIAVGSRRSTILPTPVAVPDSGAVAETNNGDSGTRRSLKELAQQSTTPSTEVTRSLGIHEDSPILAHLLGRTPKKRCINVYEEDEAVDILSLDKYTNVNPGKVAWRMSYAQRSKVDHANEDPEVSITNPPIPAPTAEIVKHELATPGTVPLPVPLGAGSRFHVVSRISVEDRSLFIPQGTVCLSLRISHLRSAQLGALKVALVTHTDGDLPYPPHPM